jgi:hypothetical protein
MFGSTKSIVVVTASPVIFFSNWYGALLVDVVAKSAAGGDQPLRILEIGGGTGGCTAPLLAALPGVMIFITSICFNLMSDGLRAAMDVKA